MSSPEATRERTIVHVMRHGEVHNPDGILYGRLPDFHLSDLGRRMAESVAAHLVDHDITHVIASPLERAQETAEPIAASHGLAIETDDRLIESANWFEGRTFGTGDASLRKPVVWTKVYNPFRPSWGEPYRQIAQRMVAAVDDARAAARGHEAVLVSHQLPVWTLRSHLTGRRLWHDPRSRECTLASLTTLTYLGDELLTVDYSEPAAALLPGSTGVGA